MKHLDGLYQRSAPSLSQQTTRLAEIFILQIGAQDVTVNIEFLLLALFIIPFISMKTIFSGSDEEGGVLAIDPVTDTVVLIQYDNDLPEDLRECQVSIVPFVDWSSVKVKDESDSTKSTLKSLAQTQSESSHGLTPEQISIRRDAIKSHLSKYGLAAEEDGENLLIGDTLIIQPPYTDQSCDATNEIILERVRKILSTL